jgi:hypothetical protein
VNCGRYNETIKTGKAIKDAIEIAGRSKKSLETNNAKLSSARKKIAAKCKGTFLN